MLERERESNTDTERQPESKSKRKGGRKERRAAEKIKKMGSKDFIEGRGFEGG